MFFTSYLLTSKSPNLSLEWENVITETKTITFTWWLNFMKLVLVLVQTIITITEGIIIIPSLPPSPPGSEQGGGHDVGTWT